MSISRSCFVIPLLLLGGCTVGPSYRPPEVAVPASYGAADAGASSPSIARWWSAFNDPVLNDLIARAQTGNLDVRQAAARVAQARAQEQATRASDGPTLNASAQAGYSQLSANSLPSALANLGTFNSGAPSSGSGIGLPGEHFATFQTGFDASWEVDLFGGQRRANEAVGARADAAIWSERDAEVTLVAEVANTYQQYRSYQRRVAIADETLASARGALEFIRVRSARGLVTTLDERSQQRNIEQLGAQRQDLSAEAAVRIHALGTLLGLEPDALTKELSSGPIVGPGVIDIPPGLPSDLLRRRPDLRAAERRLAAATADIGVATADLYPKFSLTGALQLASRSLSNLVESDSVLGNGSGRLSLPLLGRDVTEATIRLREAQADEALLGYRANIFTALKDVEDSLTRLDADRQRADRFRAAEQEAKDAEDTNAVRYRHGLTGYLDVLSARQTLLSASDNLAQAEATAAQDEVALYKALGGGWDERRTDVEKAGTRGQGS